MGTGNKIFVWHPNRILYHKYGHRAIYDAASNLNAKVSSVLVEGNWF